MGWFILITIIAIIIGGVISAKNEQEKIALMAPDEKQKYLEEMQLRLAEANYGLINTAMTCPHCQTIRKIRTKNIKQKKGVSGGKATAAVFTGGLSLLAVGLSRKEGATQAHCDNCNNTWFF